MILGWVLVAAMQCAIGAAWVYLAYQTIVVKELYLLGAFVALAACGASISTFLVVLLARRREVVR